MSDLFSSDFCAMSVAAVNTSVFRVATPQAETIRGLFVLILAISFLIFLAVEGTMVYCLFRFRAGRGPEGEPAQIYGSAPIELAWTLLPLLIVFVLFLVVIRALVDVRPTHSPKDALPITVVAHQWWWEYRFPTLGFITANELHVPVSTAGHPEPVYLTLRSADVIHSYWVPQLGGKTDVIPGKTNYTMFDIQKPGLYLGRCSEYCGHQHANMMIRVYAEPRAAFDAWAKHQAEPAVDDPSVRAERDTFMGLPCINCHTVRGTRATGTFGPDLTHLMSRDTIGTGLLKTTRKGLTTWVRDPQAIKPGCHMPHMKLDDKTINSIVTYLLTLK